MIPKIIHQTWKDNNLPPILQEIVAHNKALLPDYEFCLWTDKDISELIQKEYPHIFKVFEATRTGVQRGDIARILLVHHYGGIYIDLDILLLKDPEDMIDMSSNKLHITYEPSEQTNRLYGRDDYLCNAFFAANARNSMLNFMVQNMHAIYLRNGASLFMQFDIFGGSFFKGIIDTYINYQNDVHIIENRDLVFPINDLKFSDLSSSRDGWYCVETGKYAHGTVMVHYWIHGDFESKKLLYEYIPDKTLDVHQNVYKFFSILYPQIAKHFSENV